MNPSLENYMRSKGLTDKAFGKLIDCSGLTVYRYRKGMRKPQDAIKKLIYEVTNKAVTPNDWVL